ncbi:MAG TPA: lysophospholipid acyltransferase family protein [Candidatus Limnocylindrales bacterium]|nr:lysophospholipid acyltransferase family protein [Candidatus Limnocylindrales bacterium]
MLRTRLVVEGAERVPDAPSVILASNHLSIMDPPILSVVLERALRRQVRYMAKAEALTYPIVGPMLLAYGGFGVRRGAADREAYRMALAVLAAGDWLGVAPEGTRSRTAKLGEPKPGVATLALRSGAPVLPVAISGSEKLWPIGARLPRFFQTVVVRIGEAYRPAEVAQAAESAGADRRAALAAVSDDLMRRIAALLPERYRGRFGEESA